MYKSVALSIKIVVSRLYFKDPKTNETHDFRWYDDKSTIMNNKNDYVYIVGEASLFGYIVRNLER